MYYRGTAGLLCVFDITNSDSINRVKNMVDNMRERNEQNARIPLLFVGAKLDLADRRSVNHE